MKLRTAIANKIHALLAKNGITNPYSELFGKKSLRWLKQLQLRDFVFRTCPENPLFGEKGGRTGGWVATARKFLHLVWCLQRGSLI